MTDSSPSGNVVFHHSIGASAPLQTLCAYYLHIQTHAVTWVCMLY